MYITNYCRVQVLSQNQPDLNIDQSEEEYSFENHVYHTEAYRELCKETQLAKDAQKKAFSPVTKITPNLFVFAKCNQFMLANLF